MNVVNVIEMIKKALSERLLDLIKCSADPFQLFRDNMYHFFRRGDNMTNLCAEDAKLPADICNQRHIIRMDNNTKTDSHIKHAKHLLIAYVPFLLN